MLSEVEPRLQRMLPAAHPAFAAVTSQRSALAQAEGNFDEALALANTAIAISEESTQNRNLLPLFLVRRAVLEIEMNRFDAATMDAARAVDLYKGSVAPETQSSFLGMAYLTLGRALLATGQGDQARESFASALEQLRPTLGADHPQIRVAEQLAAKAAASGRK